MQVRHLNAFEIWLQACKGFFLLLLILWTFSLCQPFSSTQGTGEGFPVSVSNVLFSTGAHPKCRAGQCCSGTCSALILLLQKSKFNCWYDIWLCPELQISSELTRMSKNNFPFPPPTFGFFFPLSFSVPPQTCFEGRMYAYLSQQYAHY